MPAAAVIPAPIAYIKVVAFKKLVVGSTASADGPPYWVVLFDQAFLVGFPLVFLTECLGWLTRLL